MIKHSSTNQKFWQSRFLFVKQRGAVVLMTATLLLIIATLTTLYTGRSQSFEHQILVNNQNHKMAVMAAEAGLQKQMAMLKVNTALPPIMMNEMLSQNNTFSVTSNIKTVNTIYGERQLVTVSSTGTSADGLAQATVSETMMIYPILQNRPVAPLMVQGGIDSLGQFELVTNTEGKGAGLRHTIWSDKGVVIGSASSTCELFDYNNGECAIKAISNSVTKGADIEENSSSFPDNIFGYLFNLPIDAVEQLPTQAKFILTNCDELTSHSRGLIWVKGECKVSLGEQLGSAVEPLILIVEDGNVQFDKYVSFYGILLSFQSPKARVHYSIDMGVGSVIKGAVLANHKLGDVNSMLRVMYEKSILVRLTKQAELQGLAKVPGSWRDF